MTAAVNSEPAGRRQAPAEPPPVVIPDDAYIEPEPSTDQEQPAAEDEQEGDNDKDGFTVQLSRPPQGPDDEVEATVVPDQPPAPRADRPDRR
jgi:hypothetical protein